MFPNISVPQAIDDDLVRAYHGENGDKKPNKGGFLYPALMDAAHMAADNLFAVIDHFKQKYPDAKVHFEDSVQDPNADEGVGKIVWRIPRSYLRNGILHRVHVRVKAPNQKIHGE